MMETRLSLGKAISTYPIICFQYRFNAGLFFRFPE